MGALTATSVTRENIGSLNLLIVKFSSVDDADTWACGHSAIIDHWARANIAADTALGASLGTSDNGSGTITFSCDASDHAVSLFVLVKD